jgi:hypothetical protein
MTDVHMVAGVSHAVFLFLHILLMAAWIGIDVGVFCASFFLRNPSYPIDQRLMIGRLAGILDMGPRASLLLMYPSGAWLAWAGGWGFEHSLGPLSPEMLLIGISVAFVCWEAAVWVQFWGHRRVMAGEAGPGLEKFLHQYRRWDIIARWFLAALLITDGLFGIFGRGFILQPWLGWKVFLFGLIVLQGIGIRWAADSWPALIRDIVENGSTPQREAALNRAMLRAYPFVLSLWGVILVIAFIGVLKVPGPLPG